VPSLSTPHRRYNPLLDEWVLCSPHRLARPWQGQVEAATPDDRPPYDPGCYLCPGNVRANGEVNPPYASTFVFDNDFPALLPDAGVLVSSEDPLRRVQPARGVCRVVCFSPRHDLSLGDMTVAAIRHVVDAWALEVSELEARGFQYVQVFENKGAMMGCSNPHPHCQVWATDYVPTMPARKVAAQDAYLAAHGRDLLGDYLARELADGHRIVAANDHWCALVPFWAVWPFETMLVPRRRVAALAGLASEERDALAAVVKDLNVRYDRLFATSFPYSMGWHGATGDGGAHPGCRLHAVYYPPLLRSATVRKFLVGYELTAEPQRDVTPELAAERLRTVDTAAKRDVRAAER
jgi:UDPglucose--hexose-1-phosphate uridylyltransferase